MNSTAGLAFKGLPVSPRRKVDAHRLLQHGGPGGAPAVGVPGGRGEPGAGEVALLGGARVGSLAGGPAQVANSQPFIKWVLVFAFVFLGKVGVWGLAIC